MKHRFSFGQKTSYRRSSLHGGLLSVAVFVAVMVAFLYAVNAMSTSTSAEQKAYLEEAVERCVLECYVTEGYYPASFSDLMEKYNLIYDEECYRVDYISYGSNMMPEITVVELEGSK